jgi:hypothetical protein
MSNENCYVCDGTEPKAFSYRCEKHDVCNVCGKKREETKQHWGRLKGGWVCGECEEKRIQDQIDNFQKSIEEGETEHWSDDGAICPNCGNLHEPDGETEEFHVDGEWETICGNCDYKFSVSTYVSRSYTTYKKEEENKETGNESF